jgi:hypothetical protein
MRPFSHLIILRLTTLGVALLLAGCEIPGIGPDPKIAARLADGKAIGSACRHALRGIEDCYALNEKALKTAVFEGWKEMDQYMRDNKIEGLSRPRLPCPGRCSRRRSPSPKARRNRAPGTSQRQMPAQKPAQARASLVSKWRRSLRAIRPQPPARNRHALHMGSVRKHVDHPGCHAAITGLMHQQPGIPCQRSRVTAHVNDALGKRPGTPLQWSEGCSCRAGRYTIHHLRATWPRCKSASAFTSEKAPSRGGSTSHLSAAPSSMSNGRRHFKQVSCYKFSSCQRTVIRAEA